MSTSEFQEKILNGIYGNIYNRVNDNYDYKRYSYDGIDRSNYLDVMSNAKYLNFVISNIESFHSVYQLLSDEFSRDLYLRLILFRALGHPHIRIKENKTWTSVASLYNEVSRYDVRPSHLQPEGLLFGELRHHENVPVETGTVSVDCWHGNVVYGLMNDGVGSRQYYLNRDNVRICPEIGDYVLDCGACFGDTAVFFSHSVGETGKVFAFEPLPSHIEVIKFNIQQNNMGDRVKIIRAGVGEISNNIEHSVDAFSKISNPGFSLYGKEQQIPIVCIDDCVDMNKMHKIDFIKMDIEGFELAALKGAKKTIERFKPKLAISLYHKQEDFFAIPLYLEEAYPYYKFYLDHHTIYLDETVLYVTT